MGLPLTREESCVAGAPVRATLLNKIQDAITWLFNGTKTVKSVHADGTGGGTSSAASGQVRASAGFVAEAGGANLTGDSAIAGSLDVSGNLKGKRLYAEGGTALTITDVGMGTGWGTGASVANVTGDDSGGIVEVVAGSSPGANPQLTISFKDGNWSGAPKVGAWVVALTTAADLAPIATGSSTSQAFLVYQGTPTSGRHYTIQWFTIGR